MSAETNDKRTLNFGQMMTGPNPFDCSLIGYILTLTHGSSRSMTRPAAQQQHRLNNIENQNVYQCEEVGMTILQTATIR